MCHSFPQDLSPQWSSLFGNLPQPSTAFEGEKNHGAHRKVHRGSDDRCRGSTVQLAQVQKTSSQPSMEAHSGIPPLRRLTGKDQELVPGQPGLYNKTLPPSGGEACEFLFEHVSQW